MSSPPTNMKSSMASSFHVSSRIPGPAESWSRKVVYVFAVAPQQCSRHRFAGRVEHFNQRIDRRSGPAGQDLDRQPVALLGSESNMMRLAAFLDGAIRGARYADSCLPVLDGRLGEFTDKNARVPERLLDICGQRYRNP